ncbi:hypothetical protein [Isoptericola sp. AK164]|uniref:hypothetical protein n=1 Tax=Isoptericola sp. AK164 TaxID=3024246 RepID=UPI002418BA9F|nr:hypothetical protein [Isoptericola sp. AK164]
MVLPLLFLALLLCALLAGWAAWFVVRDRAVILRQLFGAAAVEAVLVVQAVVAGVLQVQGHAVDGPLFWGYLLTAALLLPLAAVWAFAERTKWSSVVLCVAALTVAFLEWRLWIIWEAGL